MPATAAAQQVGAGASAPSAESDRAARLALAREIIAIGFPEADREQLFFGAINEMTRQVRQAALARIEKPDPGALSIIDKWIAAQILRQRTILVRHIPALMDGMARGYAELFTAEELRGVHAFVQTPAGLTFFLKSSQITAQPAFAEANQAYMREILVGTPDAQAELIEQLSAYAEGRGAN
ncbi:DUF2059 domain-containing protein [Qipengyuania sp. YIM B01966]|uniref:DUF2059 domain-containing protein n=1 Tax=Qipengyuania sp. YIM B01966 TaxID=2778646 RepID=UPI0018F35D7C|nr:DUF2059 domain-containing protein [Qipengyuania sp. YIM B01966]